MVGNVSSGSTCSSWDERGLSNGGADVASSRGLFLGDGAETPMIGTNSLLLGALEGGLES